MNTKLLISGVVAISLLAAFACINISKDQGFLLKNNEQDGNIETPNIKGMASFGLNAASGHYTEGGQIFNLEDWNFQKIKNVVNTSASETTIEVALYNSVQQDYFVIDLQLRIRNFNNQLSLQSFSVTSCSVQFISGDYTYCLSETQKYHNIIVSGLKLASDNSTVIENFHLKDWTFFTTDDIKYIGKSAQGNYYQYNFTLQFYDKDNYVMQVQMVAGISLLSFKLFDFQINSCYLIAKQVNNSECLNHNKPPGPFPKYIYEMVNTGLNLASAKENQTKFNKSEWQNEKLYYYEVKSNCSIKHQHSTSYFTLSLESKLDNYSMIVNLVLETIDIQPLQLKDFKPVACKFNGKFLIDADYCLNHYEPPPTPKYIHDMVESGLNQASDKPPVKGQDNYTFHYEDWQFEKIESYIDVRKGDKYQFHILLQSINTILTMDYFFEMIQNNKDEQPHYVLNNSYVNKCYWTYGTQPHEIPKEQCLIGDQSFYDVLDLGLIAASKDKETNFTKSDWEYKKLIYTLWEYQDSVQQVHMTLFFESKKDNYSMIANMTMANSYPPQYQNASDFKLRGFGAVECKLNDKLVNTSQCLNHDKPKPPAPKNVQEMIDFALNEVSGNDSYMTGFQFHKEGWQQNKIVSANKYYSNFSDTLYVIIVQLIDAADYQMDVSLSVLLSNDQDEMELKGFEVEKCLYHSQKIDLGLCLEKDNQIFEFIQFGLDQATNNKTLGKGFNEKDWKLIEVKYAEVQLPKFWITISLENLSKQKWMIVSFYIYVDSQGNTELLEFRENKNPYQFPLSQRPQTLKEQLISQIMTSS